MSVRLWTKWLWVRVQLQSPLFLLLGSLIASITGWIFWTGQRYFHPWKVKHFATVSFYVLIFKFRYWCNSFRQKFNRILRSSYDKCGFRAIFMMFRDPLNVRTFLVFFNNYQLSLFLKTVVWPDKTRLLVYLLERKFYLYSCYYYLRKVF